MIRKSYILAFILMLGFTLSLTNGFADEVPEPIFEVRIPESEAYIQGNEDIRRGPDSIFGTPDFEKMRDLPENSRDYQLGRKVAFIFTPVAPGASRGFICTGFLVGPDLLLTNHHCVHDDFGRPFPLELIQIYMDYYQEPDVDRTQGGVTAGVTAVLQADAPKDYALLRLDKPIGNTYGWLELDTTTRVNSTQSVKLISHNAGRSKEIVRRNSQIVDIPAGHPLARVPFALAYLADTEGGSSGSPIFLRDGTGVIGINHSSWYDRDGPTFNAGSLMSHIVPEIQEWLPGGAAPDLAVGSPRVSNPFLQPGESFTLSATVRNQGTVAAPATTLQFYRSSDSTITASDVEVGSASVRALAPNATTELDITLTAPTSESTYYYGGCVDAVGNEGRIDNNCSTAVEINVSTTPPFWIYWTEKPTGILRVVNDGTNPQFLVNASSDGIALDVESGKMYWGNNRQRGSIQIQRANLDGSNVEVLVTVTPWVYDIALDVAAGKMYWTTSDGQIERANLDGSNVEVLVTGLSDLYSIALDVAAGKMYWWNRQLPGSGQIERANLDGSNAEVLVRGMDWVHDIALDVTAGKMYWWNNHQDSSQMQRANLDGSNVENFITITTWVYGMALDVAAGKMYWTTDDGQIQRANLDSSNVEILVSGIDWPWGIALGILQPTRPSTFPDLVVEAPQASKVNLQPGESFSLEVSVRNQGAIAAPATTLRFYQSADSTITSSDVEVGSASVRALAPNGLQISTLSLTAPTSPGTYDYGACVDPVGNERGTDNNCSTAVTITVEETAADPLDVNGDGQVTVMDLVAVALFYGTQVSAGIGSLPVDVNADGVVNILDLTAVAQRIDAAGGSIHGLSLEEVEAALLAVIDQMADIEAIAEAPIGASTPQHVLPKGVYNNVADALTDARHFATGDVHAMLKGLLQALTELGAIPETTALLPNYPNPFNPETWIPYQLAKPTEVTITIYAANGQVVRTLALGHQPAGIYQTRSRAAYWDGRNAFGEPVASGVYFYTITAGDFTATRKMLIRK